MDSKINKHSSGPWYPGHLGDDSINCKCRTIVNEGYAGGIATVHLNNGKNIEDGGNDAPTAEEATANMHLIAASPDLLDSVDMLWDALEDIEGFYVDQNDDEGFWETLAVLRTNLRWVRKKARNELNK